MSNEFGYIGEVEQSFGNNKGIFTPTDIYDLTRADKFTQYGQFELIETQTTTNGTSALDFNSIGNFDVHFLSFTNFQATSAETNIALRFSEDGGSTFDTTNYEFSYWFGRNTNPLEQKSTNSSLLGYAGQITSSTVAGGYFRCHNLLDGTKESFANYHSFATSNTTQYSFGGGVCRTATIHNSIRLTCNTDSFIAGGVATLYGYKLP